MKLRPLPAKVVLLCQELEAPPRLIAHLTLVHDVACELLDAMTARYPGIAIDADAVRFGAATHDIGKIVHRTELTSPGTAHETYGEELLQARGIPPTLSRFARTHGDWTAADVTLEDLLVALSDSIWKGKRIGELESKVARHIAELAAETEWETWSWLDDVIQQIASRADRRLAWQQSHTA